MGGGMVTRNAAILTRLLSFLYFLGSAAAVMALPGAASAQEQEGTAELFIELENPDAKPVVGEMVLMTIRGVYDVVITLEKMELPRVDGFDWVQIENDEWSREQVDGKEKSVFRRRIALFAKKAGELTIGPFVHRLTVQPRVGGRIMMNIEAPPLTLSVAPYPGGSDKWPFSAKLLEYSDEWSADPSTLGDGDTVVRTVTLGALGVIPELVPPQPLMRAYWLITFSPPEQRELILTEKGPITKVTWSWEMRPITGEPGVIREYTIPWLNTQTREMEMMELAAAPFGYASFAENKNALALTAGDARPVLGLITLTGMAVSAIFLFGTLRARPTVRWRALRRAALHALAKVAMMVAAFRKDPVALRRATDFFLATAGTPPDREQIGALQRLDFLIYSRSGDKDGFDYFHHVRCFWAPLG
jgi:hypothetical protein